MTEAEKGIAVLGGTAAAAVANPAAAEGVEVAVAAEEAAVVGE